MGRPPVPDDEHDAVRVYLTEIFNQDVTPVEVVTAAELAEMAGGGSTTLHTHTGLSSPLTTKGDTHGFSTVDARVPIGLNGQVLTADSVQTLGLKWAASGSAAFAPPKTKFVDADGGSDANGGDAWDDAYATIGKALTILTTGGTILFAGTETVTASIQMRDDIQLLGYGWGQSTIVRGGTGFHMISFGTNKAKRCVIADIDLDGNKAVHTTNVHADIMLTSVSSTGANDNEFLRLRIRDSSEYGVRINGAGTDDDCARNTFKDCTFETNDEHHFFANHNAPFTQIINCFFGVSGSTGNGVWMGNSSDHSSVIGSRFDSCGDMGIEFFSASRCKAIGNTILDVGTFGISFDTNHYGVATGNVIDNPGITGLENAGGTNVVFSGNTITSSAAFGISCSQAGNITTVIGNDIDTVADGGGGDNIGIGMVDSGDGCVISGNRITDAGNSTTDPIRIQGTASRGHKVVDNYVRRTSTAVGIAGNPVTLGTNISATLVRNNTFHDVDGSEFTNTTVSDAGTSNTVTPNMQIDNTTITFA